MRYLLALLLCLALPVHAQSIDDDDGGRGFLAGLIEDALSDTSRQVRIVGFRGALSSRASVERIEVEDREGVWLRITDATLDWNRSALLRGRLEVEELVAATIEIARPPIADPDVVPEPTAGGFAIPDLPVAVEVGRVAAERVELGAPILGEAAVFSVEGQGTLEDGALDAALEATRVDGVPGTFRLAGAFAPETRVLTVELALDEDAGGIAATALNLPGAPALELAVAGEGPLNDFAATIDLDTGGADRLGGTFTLLAEGESPAGPTRRFDLDVEGNVAPLLAPDLAPFFGDDLSLRVVGAREPSGRLRLETLAVEAAALSLSGTAEIAPDNLPERFDLDLALGAGGEPVRLPLAAEVLVTGGALNATFDAEDGERWTLTGRVEGIDAEAAEVAVLTLAGGGTISRAGSRAITAEIDLVAEGIAPSDPALADALGERVVLAAALDWDDESPVDIESFALDTQTARISGTGSLSRGGEAIGPELTLDAMLDAPDLSRFAALAGTDLAGRLDVGVEGTVASTGGAFDLRIEGAGSDLAVGIEAVDNVIGGAADLVIDAARDEAGTTLREVRLATAALSLDASGTVAPETADLTLDIALDDLARVAPDLPGGPVTLTGTAGRAEARWTADLDVTAPAGTTAAVEASVPDDGTARIDFDARVARLEAFVPALPGEATLRGQAERSGADWTVVADVGAPQGIEAAVEASVPEGGPVTVDYDAEIADLAAFVPQLPGPATAQGRAVLDGDVLTADLDLAAPQGIDAEADLRRGADGVLTADVAARVAEMSVLVPALEGPLTATGTARIAEGVTEAELDVDGPQGITADVTATQDAEGRLVAEFDARIDDLSPFAPPLEGPATATGTATLDAGVLTARLDATAPEGITAGIDARRDAEGVLAADIDARIADLGALAPAPLEGAATLTGTVRQADGETRADLALRTDQGLAADVEATLPAEGPLRASYDARVDDVGTFTEAVSGPARLTGTAERASDGTITTDARLTGPAGADLAGTVRLAGADLAADVEGVIARPGEIREGIPGPLDIDGTFARTDGALSADVVIDAPGEDRIELTAALPPSGEANVVFDAFIARPDRFLNGLPGPLTAEGTATRGTEGTWRGEVDAAAGDGSTLTASGRFDPAAPAGEVAFDARIAELGRFVPQVPGEATATGTAELGEAGISVDAVAALADGSRVEVDGVLPAEGAEGTLRFDARLANLGRFVPQLQGPATATGTATREGADYVVNARLNAPAATTATLDARIGTDRQEVSFDARVGNVGVLVPRLPGAVTAQGTAVRRGEEIDLDVDVAGIGGLRADIQGTLGQRLDVVGALPLEIANPFIRPRSVGGTARFDLVVEGPPALDAVSGTITLAGARVSIPRQRQSIEDISGTITLSAGSAAFDLTGGGRYGGTIAVGGTANLAARSFDVEIALRGIVLRDPLLYETTLDGDLAFRGSTTSGGAISGRIDLLETEVRLGDAPIGGSGAIPPITHIADAPAVEATRDRARLTATGGSQGTNRDGTPRNNAFALDILISAERRIFIRGRGLDAELGGTLQLAGSTAQIIPIGQFDLIRGRIDILGRRLTLTEGSARLQGDFNPTVRLVATTQSDEGDVSVVIEGPISAPEITFESASGLPEDEVLAQLIFGRGLQTLTPFQAARLASAVATLTGRGGGFLGGLRDNFGLDDLDLTTAEDGTAALRFGTYLTENIYSDVIIDAEGEAALTLNLDITRSLTARGTMSSSGETGIGIFFERDY